MSNLVILDSGHENMLKVEISPQSEENGISIIKCNIS